MHGIVKTFAAAAAFILVSVGWTAAQEPPGRETARDITLVADVIDLSCRVVHNLSGPDHRMCAQVCADKGIPLALFADGQVYVPVSLEMPGAGANERLKPFAEQRVRVRGKVIDRAGIRTIVIEEIRPA